MRSSRCCCGTGGGIGPEITRATLRVLEVASRRFGLGLAFEEHTIGLAALEQSGSTLPDGVLERARTADGILLGPISHLDYPARELGGVNVSAAFRVGLDLSNHPHGRSRRPARHAGLCRSGRRAARSCRLSPLIRTIAAGGRASIEAARRRRRLYLSVANLAPRGEVGGEREPAPRGGE